MSIEYPLCRYRFDVEDRLIWVDPWWLAFARENNASELTESNVLGRRMSDFVGDSLTRQLYRDINERVRCSRKSVVLPFRCDSPSIRRHMQLTISSDGSGSVNYDSLLLRAEPRESLRILCSRETRSTSALEMCSNCKYVYLHDQHRWCELDRAYIALRLFEVAEPPETRYTICPTCFELVKQSEAFAG